MKQTSSFLNDKWNLTRQTSLLTNREHQKTFLLKFIPKELMRDKFQVLQSETIYIEKANAFCLYCSI